MTPPVVQDFKDQYNRDFKFGVSPKTVMDTDVQSALNRAGMNFPGFFGTQSDYSMAYLALAAHHLVMNISASTKGLAGQGTWLTNSKGVGNVNEAFTIPQRIIDNPALAGLSKTRYGMDYLQMIYPYLVAPAFSVGRRSAPG